MFEQIVVGYDGSGGAEDALSLARDLARISDGRVTVVRQYLREPVHTGDGTAHPHEAPTAGERMLADLAARFDGELDARGVSAASPARGLHEVADEIHADLIVVGSTHRGRFGRAIPGTAADRLLHGGPCAVAIAPAGYQHRDPSVIRRIGAAYCGSPEAELAVREALAVAAAADARVEVLNVFEDASFQSVDTGMGAVGINAHEFAVAELEGAIARLTPGRPVATVVLDGHPVDALIERAGDLDLLVMGSRAYGPVARALAGSISHGVLTHGCPCPVVVVPRSAKRDGKPFAARAVN